MLRFLKLAMPVFALMAGLMVMPSGSVARAAQSGLHASMDDYRFSHSVPSVQRRLAPRRHIYANTDMRSSRRAAKRSKAYRAQVSRARQSAYWLRNERGRAAPVTSSRHRAAQRTKAQRNRLLKRQAVIRHSGHAQVQQRALPRMASLGNAPLSRFTAPTSGRIEAQVDIRNQRMVVKVDGEVRHVWKVSTGKSGFATPRGVYGPKRMHATYFSRKYYNSPMPYSIFFRGGYAVHGTNDLKRLGGPASHGCVRLAVPHARALFQLVRAYGPARARIVIG